MGKALLCPALSVINVHPLLPVRLLSTFSTLPTSLLIGPFVLCRCPVPTSDLVSGCFLFPHPISSVWPAPLPLSGILVRRASPYCSAGVNEDSPCQKIGSSKSPQNDLIDPQTDGYHSSKEREYSSSPGSGSGSGRSIVQKGFESDGPAVSEPDLSGSSEHMNCGNRPSPST